MSGLGAWARSTTARGMRRLGYEIRRARPADRDEFHGYDLEPQARDAIARVRDHTMVPYDQLVVLYQLSAFAERSHLPGAFVECGVWKGGCVGLMAIANLDHGSSRRALHLFDSFREICHPDEDVDGARAADEARRWAGVEGPLQGQLEPLPGFYDHLGGPGSAAECKELLEHTIGYDPAQVSVHEGWFQDTLPGAAEEIGDIALLHLDADYYAATALCLELLYPRVVAGGFVVVDDYGRYEGCRTAVDEFVAGLDTPLYLHHVDAASRYLVKP